MNEPSSKLDRLGDILGVDETAEVERPEPRRGLGDVLAGGNAALAAAGEPTTDVTAPLQEEPPRSSSTRRVRTKPAPAPASASTKVDADGSLKRRTSSTIPVDVTARLDLARDRRWSINRVIASAIQHHSLDLGRAEELLERHTGSPLAVCSYRIPVADMAVLDELADAWRMSRSQVVTIMLDNELTRLGF